MEKSYFSVIACNIVRYNFIGNCVTNLFWCNWTPTWHLAFAVVCSHLTCWVKHQPYVTCTVWPFLERGNKADLHRTTWSECMKADLKVCNLVHDKAFCSLTWTLGCLQQMKANLWQKQTDIRQNIVLVLDKI